MPVKCNKKALVTCQDCEDAGKKCIAQTGNKEKCAKLGWNSKTEKCLKCPKDAPETCDDCIQMGNKCIEQVIFNNSYTWNLVLLSESESVPSTQSCKAPTS